MDSIRRSSAARQRGAVLVVSLLILLVLTVIGIVAMYNTSLDEKMAGNMRQRDLAFQAAEAAMQDAQIYIVQDNPVAFDTSCTGGLCLDPSASGAPYWEQPVSWWQTNGLVYPQVAGVQPLAGLSNQPRYIIEKMVPTTLRGGSLGDLGDMPATGLDQLYRITAQGTADNGNIVVQLQSVYLP